MDSENLNQKPTNPEGSERPAHQHTGQTPPPLSPSVAVLQQPPTPNEQGKPKKKDRDWVDYTTMGLEVFGLAVLIAYTTFAALQWCEMQRATNGASRNFKRDERAWIAFKFVEGNLTLTLNKSFLVPTELVNTGKTPAKNVHGDIVIGVFKKGEPPDFTYTAGHAHYKVTAGTIFPNGKIVESFEAIKHGQDRAEAIIFTSPLKDELFNGQSLLVVHGRIEYTDIFGIDHWTTYCRYVLHPELISQECTSYNDTDNN